MLLAEKIRISYNAREAANNKFEWDRENLEASLLLEQAKVLDAKHNS